jgi:hypothetical protein
MASRRRHWRYFFPFQLLLLHLKKNHFLLAIWLLLFAIVAGDLGHRMGIPQLFLVPEYMGRTGPLSFGMLGFAVGGFISGFNLYTYIMHGYRFPVIATLGKPFHKFCINNFLLPTIFIMTFLFHSASFQLQHEWIAPADVVVNLLSFLIAVTFFQSLSYFYFLYTNKEASAYGRHLDAPDDDAEEAPVQSTIHQPLSWLSQRLIGHKWRVDSYLTSYVRIARARDARYYKPEVLQRVFAQNHVNASRFELLILISFLVLGALSSVEVFILPAASSVLLLLTMMIMGVSALHSWLRGWTFTLIIIFLVVLNATHEQLQWFRNPTTAYGLDYTCTPAIYNPTQLVYDSTIVQSDLRNTEQILKRRLNRIQVADSSKPKLVILNHSGGGTRSAYWTMRAIPYADSICGGRLLQHTALMTGASGGLVGAAYLRELMLRSQMEYVDLNDATYADRMALDLLNPVILSAATNDWFIRYRRLHDGKYSYAKDRATALEEQFARNTDYAFERRLGDYTALEQEALIPLMILTPTIINDGRRLLIGSQPYSYMCLRQPANKAVGTIVEDVEFMRLFAANDGMNLRFSSALRMNAAFPYVTPMTNLPSSPVIEVFDAGIRDNFGWKTTCQFIFALRQWIEENTSGVVVVQVRDLPRDRDLDEHKISLFNKLFAPLGGIYGNLPITQDYMGDETMTFLQSAAGVPIDVIQLQMEQTKEAQISLSWHLTKSEKNYIFHAVKAPYFESELARLKRLIE